MIEGLLLVAVIALCLGMVMAATWLVGLWNNVISWVILVLAALVASSFFEPLATRIDQSSPQITYLADFISVWGLFICTFIVLRVATEVLSRYRLQFDPWTELIGRSVMSLAIALTLFAFASFTLRMAPLPVSGFWGARFQASPDARSFGIGADRAWMGFVRTSSLGSLSEFRENRMLFPYDLASDSTVREFDPQRDLMARYYQRRRILSEQADIQISQTQGQIR
jgi:hypothetical protein